MGKKEQKLENHIEVTNFLFFPGVNKKPYVKPSKYEEEIKLMVLIYKISKYLVKRYRYMGKPGI